MANSWHAITAVQIISPLIASWTTDQAVPWSLNALGHSRLDQLRQLYLFNPVIYNIGYSLSKMGQVQLVPEQDDPMKHMEMALNTLHPAFKIAFPEDTYVRAAVWQQRLGHELARWRTEVLSEIEAMVIDEVDEQSS